MPTAVSRAVEFLNSARSIDTTTGYVDYGFEAYLKRRALDYLTLGRTAFALRRKPGVGKDYLEYLDPTKLSFNRNKNVTQLIAQGANASYSRPVKPNEQVWEYMGEWLKDEDVTIHHPIPIGSNRFTAPILQLIPTATLSWLIREHDTAALDGRKIRDVIFVGNVSMFDAIKEALVTSAALWSGASPEDVGGIPVVEVNNPAGTPMENYFARLGISNIPDAFDREEFIFRYVNEIAAALGLALRHFWNNEKTTNRALEVVQEQRQQQKGPSVFVRSEQRMINNSGIMDQFRVEGKSVRFGFLEESDASSLKDRADVLAKTAEALEKMSLVLGAQIKPESFISWMQSLGQLPNELEFIEGAPDLVANSPGGEINTGDEITDASDPTPTTESGQRDTGTPADNFQKGYLDYDEVTMNNEGKILSRRRKIWHFSDVLEHEVAKRMKAVYPVNEETLDIEDEVNEALTSDSDEEGEDALSYLLRLESTENRVTLKRLQTYQPDEVEAWIYAQKKYDSQAVDSILSKCLNNTALTDDEQIVVDYMVESIQEDDYVIPTIESQ